MKEEFISFHKPYITEGEINEVVDTIKSGWWTTGPKTKIFENEFKKFFSAPYALAVNSWTAAAHLSLEAIGLKPGDEVIIPAITFTATAEVVCYFNAVPVVVDIEPSTLNISIAQVEKFISNKTKAIIPVHYGGLPCDMDEIRDLSQKHNFRVIEDAAHAIPSYYKDKIIGSFGDISCFSFYVTKPLATGEGGMICTSDSNVAERCSIMRLHGISHDSWDRYTKEGSWYYEVVSPGFKYNFTDIQASLGLQQLKKVDELFNMRREIAHSYNDAFKNCDLFKIPVEKSDRRTSWHLYTIQLNLEALSISRNDFIRILNESGIGTSVHFIPLYKHPYYRDTFKLEAGNFPSSQLVYERIVSLPIWPGMKKEQINRVIDVTIDTLKRNKK